MSKGFGILPLVWSTRVATLNMQISALYHMCITLGKHCITKSKIRKACSTPQSTFKLLIYRAKGQALDLTFQQIAGTRY